MKISSKLFFSLLIFLGLFFIAFLFIPDSWTAELSNKNQGNHEKTQERKNALHPSPETLQNSSISVVYSDTKKFQKLKQTYQKKAILENIFASLEVFIKLPSVLTAEYSECTEENAFYDPETNKITLCYEIIDWAESIAKQNGKPEEVASNILIFFSLHEVAHALIDLYKLPITGREEDVADQLATFFLLGNNDAGILDTADSFYNDLSGLEANELPFADEHSLDHQRYYNILCWVYGSDIKTYDYLVTEGFIPEDRAEICEDEYVTFNNSFLTLLEPYIKK